MAEVMVPSGRYAPPRWTVLPRNLAALGGALALALLLHFWIQPLAGQFVANVLAFAGINIILAVSLTLVNGFTGQFSIGHGGFMALGGYAAAAVTYYGSFRLWGSPAFRGGLLSWPMGHGAPPEFLLTSGDGLFLAACLVGGLVAAAAGYLVGLPSLRLRGDYLAIVTLGFGEIVRVMLQGSRPQLFGSAEISGASYPTLCTSLGGALGFIQLPAYTSLFWIYLLAALTLAAVYRIKRSGYGRAFLSIREDEIAAEAMGVHTTRLKVRAFVLSAFFAGVAGALYAHVIGSIAAGELGFQKSFDVVIMVVLGGMGSISGSTLAATLLTILPEYLRRPVALWPYALAAALLVLLVRRRRGAVLAAWLAGPALFLELMRLAAGRVAVDLAELRMVFYALLLIVMMIVRPQGLLGLREVWELWGRRKPGRSAAASDCG